MKTVLFATFGAAALTLGAVATPFDHAPRTFDYRQEYLPADTTLVAHFDLSNFRRSTFGKLFLASRDQFELDELDELTDELGFDPVLELGSITLYGAGESPEPGTLVIVASDSVDEALHDLGDEEGFVVLREGNIDIFSYDDSFGYVERRGSDRVIVVSNTKEGAIKGARVVRGEAPSLADAPNSALRRKPVAGSFLFVIASEGVPGLDGSEPASQIFGLAQGVQFDLGEAGGSVFAKLAVATGSHEAANDVADIARALMAIARLSTYGSDVPGGARELLRALQIGSYDGTVSIDFEYPIEALAALLQSVAGEMSSERGEHSHDDDDDDDDDEEDGWRWGGR